MLPPTIHPDTGSPYRWQGTGLEPYDPEDLPMIPPESSATSGPCSCRWAGNPSRLDQTRQWRRSRLDEDADTPHRQLNNFALAYLERWVPKLGLYKCRPARGGYEAVAPGDRRRPGVPDSGARHLKIVPDGISDFGAAAVAMAVATPRSTW